jgi:hypothetical protein
MGGMAGNDSQSNTSVLKLAYFAPYDLEYNIGRCAIISVVQLQQMFDVRFDYPLLEQIILVIKNNLGYHEDLDRTRNRELSPNYMHHPHILYFKDQL